MRDGRPPADLVLYSHHLFELVKHLFPIATRVRSRIRKEVIASEKLPTIANVNERMFNNETARSSFALSMLDHVVHELSGFIIAHTLKDKWLSPVPAKRALETGAIGEFHQFAEFPSDFKQESILELREEDIRSDPALIAIRLAVQAIDATLKQPEYLSSLKSSERKSRYLESDQIVKAYAEKIDEYDQYLSSPENFMKWWNGASPILAVRKLLLG